MQLWSVSCCVIKYTFVPAKFCHYVYADFCRWSSNILPSFAFCFTSRNSWNVLSQSGTPQYNGLNVQSSPKFQSAKRFYYSQGFSKMQGLDVTVMVFRWVEKQLYAGPNQLSLPFCSQFTLRIYTAMNGLGGSWGRKNWLCPRAQEPLGTQLFTACYWLQLNERYLPIFAVDPTAFVHNSRKICEGRLKQTELKISKSHQGSKFG